MPWARPNEHAEVVAITESGRPSIFGYQAGAQTPRGTAPAQRAALLLPETPEDYGVAAWVLFDASIRWALGEAPYDELSLATLFSGGNIQTLGLGGGSGPILLVVANDLSLTASEQTYKDRMTAMGFTIQVIKASVAVSGDATNPTPKKLVFVSKDSPNGDVLDKFRLVNVPVLIQNAGIVDDMGMTSPANRGVDSASKLAVVVTPTDPLVAPIAAQLTGTQTISTTAGGQNWGIGSTNAKSVLRHTTNSTHATLFVYNTGAQMYDIPAPHRRVLFGPAGSIPETFTSVGSDFFDRTIFWATNTNPVPYAGPDQAAMVDAPITLQGLVYNNGVVVSPPTVAVEWVVVQQPAHSLVSFGDPPTELTPEVTMNNTGDFIFRLKASNDNRATWKSDDVLITVHGEESNQPPTVDAGPNQVFYETNPSPLTLFGSASDEGLPNPPGVLSLTWSKVSGPGTVTFGSPTLAETNVSFSLVGTYVLRLTAKDCDPALYPTECASGGWTNYDDVVVTYQSKPAMLVVGVPGALTIADIFVKERIQALGFPVVLQDAASVTAGGSQADGKAFVWVAHSSPNNSVVGKFKNKQVPVVIEASGVLDEMLMATTTNQGSIANQTQGVLASPPTSPLSGGLGGIVTTNTTPTSHQWGIPNANGIKVVTLVSNQTRATVFSYEQGVAMYGTPALQAPERRVFFGMWGFETPTPETKRIVDATILWVARTNVAPWPNAGPDLTATLSGGSADVTLSGSVVDDGMPDPPKVVTTTWSVVSAPPTLSGPAPVTFGNVSSLSTNATFTVAGDYILKLHASDSVLPRIDLALVTILTPGVNAPPTVSAGPDRTVKLGAKPSLTAIAADDGLPVNPLTYSWTKVSGSGTVTFGTPSAKTTTASFSAAGIYVLRVTVNDGAILASDEVLVKVEPAANALLVVGSLSLPANDTDLKTRLEELGMSVIVKSNTTAGPTDIDEKAIVVVSDSVSSTALSSSFRNALRDKSTPVLCQEPNLYDDIKMTGTVLGTDFGTTQTQTAVITSTHELAAELSGTVFTHKALVSVGFGNPAATATKVAMHQVHPLQSLLFAYHEGVTMAAGFPSPGRRIGMFSPGDIQPTIPNTTMYTPEGGALFDAAVRWLTEKRAPVLLVTGSATLNASDQAIRSRLLNQGYPTTTKTSAAVTSADANGNVLVFIAPSVNSGALSTKLRDVAVPVITTNSGVFPNMALTGATTGVHFGTAASQSQVTVTNPYHPMGALLSGTKQVLKLIPPPAVTDTFSWGAPDANVADIVATVVNDAGKKAIFGYEVGDAMVGVSAPERRVALWLGPISAQALTTEGLLLLDSAVSWAMASDGDRDGLGFLEEFRLGTSPSDADSNDDGILDGIAADSSVSPTNPDADGDGITNAQERAKGTDPFQFDTDEDEVNDLDDCFPLEPTRWDCPSGSDALAPVITLIEPTNATLVNFVCTPPGSCP
jgi:hypothetical protein